MFENLNLTPYHKARAEITTQLFVSSVAGNMYAAPRYAVTEAEKLLDELGIVDPDKTDKGAGLPVYELLCLERHKRS